MQVFEWLICTLHCFAVHLRLIQRCKNTWAHQCSNWLLGTQERTLRSSKMIQTRLSLRWRVHRNKNRGTGKVNVRISGWAKIKNKPTTLAREVSTVCLFSRAQLFKRWIVLSIELISIQWIVQLVSLILIHWRVIYVVNSAITLLNNWGQPVPKSQ